MYLQEPQVSWLKCNDD